MQGGERSGYSASSISSPSLSSSSAFESTSGSHGTFGSSASFGAHTGGHFRDGDTRGQTINSRREMEMEEHYENGQLVSGRKEDKEWKNDNLLRHDLRHYGEVCL